MADKNYIDPVTGEPCTKAEYNTKCAAAGITPTTTPTVAPTGGIKPTTTGTQGIWYQGEYLGDVGADFAGLDQPEQEAWIKETFEVDVSGQMWGFGGAPGPPRERPPRPTTIPTAPMPTFGAGAAAGIPTPTVTPAPPYEISPEQKAWEEEYGGKLTDWVEAGGYGIPEEVQAQMIQLQTDTLKAREQENIRVMKNNMERRGITNSGYIDANMHMITSNTTVALAGAIADVQIKSALMKMASFEKAMGAASQFLGYLSEQSQLAYAPEFATWQAEQLATMQKWQGQMDILKIDLNQAYQTQNIREQARLQGILAEQQHGYDIELAEMEIEFQQEAAKAEGAGQLMGSVSGLVGSFIAGS